jgi:ABC-type glycerol-3-phosphate transport system substrate-binding protein
MSRRRSWGRTSPVGFIGVAAWFVLVCGLLFLAGCGGTTTTSTVAPITPTTAAPVPGEGIMGREITASEDTPFEVARAFSEQQPVVVLFYVAGGSDDQPVRDALSRIAARYPDIAFALYDYKLPEAYGDLAVALAVDYTPYTVFIGADGIVAHTVTGFADEAVLQQFVENLQQGT